MRGVASALRADFANLVFEKLAQRLDEFELHVLRQPADVVMALDERGGIAPDGDALDHVGVEGALREELEFGFVLLPGEGFHGVLKDADEFVPDDLALSLGGGDAAESF